MAASKPAAGDGLRLRRVTAPPTAVLGRVRDAPAGAVRRLRRRPQGARPAHLPIRCTAVFRQRRSAMGADRDSSTSRKREFPPSRRQCGWRLRAAVASRARCAGTGRRTEERAARPGPRTSGLRPPGPRQPPLMTDSGRIRWASGAVEPAPDRPLDEDRQVALDSSGGEAAQTSVHVLPENRVGIRAASELRHEPVLQPGELGLRVVVLRGAARGTGARVIRRDGHDGLRTVTLLPAAAEWRGDMRAVGRGACKRGGPSGSTPRVVMPSKVDRFAPSSLARRGRARGRVLRRRNVGRAARSCSSVRDEVELPGARDDAGATTERTEASS
jgi:hypothetical protein